MHGRSPVLVLVIGLVIAGCPATPAGPVEVQSDAGETPGTDAASAEDAGEAPRLLLIAPPAQAGFVDDLVSFRAFLEDAAGEREDVTGVVTWSMEGDPVGSFKAPGVVLIEAPGQAQIKASLDGDEASAELTGQAVAANVVNIWIEPAAIEVPVGLTTPARAVAFYDDGQARDVTGQATWDSLDPTLFSVEQLGEQVTVQGEAEGSGQLRASFAGLSVEAPVEVVAADLVAIEIYPAAPHVPAGSGLQIYALGRFADGELYNLTDAVTWSSSDAGVATVSTQAGSRGLVTGVAQGSAVLTARSDANDIEGSVDVTVTPAQIVALNIAPAVIRVPAGGSVAVRATAVLTSEVVIDVTLEAVWEVDDGEVALLSSGGGAPIAVEGVFPASTTLRASYGGRSASAQVTVTAAELELIEVYPAEWQLAVGAEQRFWCVGTYSDGTRNDLTADVTWASSDTAVAYVSEPPPGRVVAASPGVAWISASYHGLSSSSQVQVSDAVAVALQIYPPLLSIPSGEDGQFRAIGVYSDNSQRDLTAETTWSVDEPGVASISNALGEWGRAVGISPGGCQVSAQFEGLSGDASLNVTDAVVTSLLVTPGFVTLTPGRMEPVDVWASYSDGTTMRVTEQAVWTSAATDIAAVSNAPGQRGWTTAVSPGQAEVTARFGGRAGTTIVYVLDQPISQVFILPEQAFLAPGLSEQLALIGIYDDLPNVYENLTVEAIWSTSDASLATVGNYPVSPGRVRGHNPGSVTVQARFGDLTATRDYAVQDVQITELEIAPADPTLPVNTLQAFVGLATFDDDSTRDVTADTLFESSDNTVLTLFEYSPGLAWALAPGTATISAEILGVPATTDVSVIEAVPTMVVLSPVNPIINQYEPIQFYATAVYDDDSTGDIGHLCSWSSSMPNVLLLLDEPGGKGYGYGLSIGSVTVSVDCDGLTDSTTATVR